jgi:hypothetical protein
VVGPKKSEEMARCGHASRGNVEKALLHSRRANDSSRRKHFFGANTVMYFELQASAVFFSRWVFARGYPNRIIWRKFARRAAAVWWGPTVSK